MLARRVRRELHRRVCRGRSALRRTTRDGSEYRGTVFISFQIKDDKLYRYREYFGLRWNDHPAWP